MSERIKMLESFYGRTDEDTRLKRSRHGQLEYLTTMAQIHRYAPENTEILEIGAGTGRYSIALAREGYHVTALELVEQNLNILKENSRDLENLHAFQGDALDLSRFGDGTFDVTLVLGPMYHLYTKTDVNKAIDEAIRVTKNNGIVLMAFLSVYSVLSNNYLDGTLMEGLDENFTAEYTVRHFEEQVFTAYDIAEFEQLLMGKAVEHLSTVAADGILELAEGRKDFAMSDEEFEAFAKYHLATCEKRELLGCSSHLLYVCRKK